jgi:hypothetical protein
MMTHSFVTTELAEQRTRALRAEADAHRLARVAARARAGAAAHSADGAAGEGVERPRRWARLWGQPGARPA